VSVDTAIRAFEQAVLFRVETQLSKLGGTTVIGFGCPSRFRWGGDPVVTIAGREVRLQVCPSVLAVLAALVGHAAEPATEGDTEHDIEHDIERATVPDVLVILTPVEEKDLGPDVLARLHRHRLIEASRQTLLQDLAGGRLLDPDLVTTNWLSDALVDHFSRTGADQRDRVVPLTRQDGVDVLLQAALGLDPSALDASTALTQGLNTRGAGLRRATDPVLLRHLINEVQERWGHLVATILRMSVRRDDLLTGLLLLDVLGFPKNDMAAAGARGILVNELVGAAQLSDDEQRAMTTAAVAYVRQRRADPAVSAAVVAADERAAELGIGALTGASAVLPSGLDRRFDSAVDELTEASVQFIAAHAEADRPHQQARVERVRCALRLRRWLATPPDPVTAVGQALQRYLDDGGWVDRALEEIGLGDPRPSVQRLLHLVRRQVADRRDATDQQTADRVAAAAGGDLGSVIPVEWALDRVVAPLAAAADARVLLVVLDGMSAATAVGLAAELTGAGGQWREIVRADTRSRTPVLAALPSETTYSRTSLLTGSLRRGTAADERAAFPDLPAWSGRAAELFHRGDLDGLAGADLGPDLTSALDPEGRDIPVVGVVLNAVDDALTKGIQGSSAHLGVDTIGRLRHLLLRASYAGRIVVVVSDHGHVLDRGELTELRSVSGGGARWRPAGSGPVATAEVAVAGPRVLTDDHRGVFAATPGLRYAKRTYGYHGGVALAEITIPLLAFVRAGTGPPAGWSLAGDLTPGWWAGDAATPAIEGAAVPLASGGSARPTASPVEPDLFQSSGHVAPLRSGPGRGAAVVRGKAYASMAEAVPAALRLDASGVGRVLDAALSAGGTITIADALAAMRVEARSERGVFAGLRRLLNVDGYEVVTVSESDRTVTVNRQLLDDQFPPRT